MIIQLLVFAYLFNQAFGQYENGIIFNDVYEETVKYYRQESKQSPPRWYCFCAVPGTCTRTGADFRITNEDPAPVNCTSGLEICCVTIPETTQAPTTPSTTTTTTTTTTTPAPTVAPPSVVNCYCLVPGTCTEAIFGVGSLIVTNQKLVTCPTVLEICCVLPPGQVPTTVAPVTPTTPTTASPPTSPTPAPNADVCGKRKMQLVMQTEVGRASFGAYPWQVVLFNQTKDFIGSGALLQPNYVLTSAHKVHKYIGNVNGLTARLGEYDLDKETEVFKHVDLRVEEIFAHPNFNEYNLENNVAIVKLAERADLTLVHVNTVCLPSTQPAANSRCWVSGWGRNIFEPTGEIQKTLREVEVPIMDNEQCELRLRLTRLGGAFVLNRKSFMCAGAEPRKDACTGDGGAPLVCKNINNQWYVAGLVAWGIGCGTPGVPGVYTNVYNFLPWINDVLELE